MSSQNPFAVPETFGETAVEVGSGKVYGGIGRLAYFGYSVLNSFVTNAISFAVGAAGIAEAVIVIALLSLVASVIIAVQRLKNLGYSGWWVLGLIVPILNILVAIRLLAAPAGYADHKTLDGPGKIIVGIIIGLFLLVIGIFVIAAMA